MAPNNMEDTEITWARQNLQGGSSLTKGGEPPFAPPLITGLIENDGVSTFDPVRREFWGQG